jgi:hypothetical protein
MLAWMLGISVQLVLPFAPPKATTLPLFVGYVLIETIL